jgi:HK97 family phage portal protein
VGFLLKPRNISTSASLDAFLRLGGNTSWSGINVTPKNALQVMAVFACIRNIAEDIGKLPFDIFQQNNERERVRATTSVYWKLIHDKPNSYQTSQQFREYMTAAAVMRGYGLAFTNKIGGQVRELLPIHPDKARVEQLPDYELLYHITMADGHEETYTKRDIFHLPGLCIDDAIGTGIIAHARQTIGNAMAANRHAGTFFGNGMKPSGVYKHPGHLSDQAYTRLKSNLTERTSGENSNATLLLEEGLDFAPVTLNAVDSQFLESRTFEVVQVCGWFRMPPHKVGELTHATFTNIEHQAIEYVGDCLMPWGVRWEYAVNQQVIVTNALHAELNYDALLRGATVDRYTAYNLAAGGSAPWMARSEIRRKENLPPIDGLDDVLVPLNMGTASNNQGAANATQGN